jgi:drug/metabolite transporter (DMT)-like permease
VYHVQPFWIVLAGALLFGEGFSRDKLSWVSVAFLGLVLVLWPKVGTIQNDRDWLVGTGYALLASLLYAGSTLTARRLKSIKPETLSTLHCGLGVLIFAPLLDVRLLAQGTASSWAWLVGLGVIHTGVVYVLLYASYPRLRTPVIAVCAFLSPAAALLCDLIVYDRAISLVQGAGLACITIAALGVNLDWPFLRWRLR